MRRLTILSLAALLIAGLTFAQHSKGMMGQGPGDGPNFPGKCKPMLNLTDEQQSKIDKLRLEHQKEMIPLRNKLQTLKSEYSILLVDEKVSAEQLNKQMDKILAVKKEMEAKKAAHQRQVRALLTDEQKIIFDQHLLNSGGRGHGNGGQGGFGGCKAGPCKRF